MDIHPDLRVWRIAQQRLADEAVLARENKRIFQASRRVHALVEQANAIQHGRIIPVELVTEFYDGDGRYGLVTETDVEAPMESELSGTNGVLDMFNWHKGQGNTQYDKHIAVQSGYATKYKQVFAKTPGWTPEQEKPDLLKEPTEDEVPIGNVPGAPQVVPAAPVPPAPGPGAPRPAPPGPPTDGTKKEPTAAAPGKIGGYRDANGVWHPLQQGLEGVARAANEGEAGAERRHVLHPQEYGAAGAQLEGEEEAAEAAAAEDEDEYADMPPGEEVDAEEEVPDGGHYDPDALLASTHEAVARAEGNAPQQRPGVFRRFVEGVFGHREGQPSEVQESEENIRRQEDAMVSDGHMSNAASAIAKKEAGALGPRKNIYRKTPFSLKGMFAMTPFFAGDIPNPVCQPGQPCPPDQQPGYLKKKTQSGDPAAESGPVQGDEEHGRMFERPENANNAFAKIEMARMAAQQKQAAAAPQQGAEPEEPPGLEGQRPGFFTPKGRMGRKYPPLPKSDNEEEKEPDAPAQVPPAPAPPAPAPAQPAANQLAVRGVPRFFLDYLYTRLRLDPRQYDVRGLYNHVFHPQVPQELINNIIGTYNNGDKAGAFSIFGALQEDIAETAPEYKINQPSNAAAAFAGSLSAAAQPVDGSAAEPADPAPTEAMSAGARAADIASRGQNFSSETLDQSYAAEVRSRGARQVGPEDPNVRLRNGDEAVRQLQQIAGKMGGPANAQQGRIPSNMGVTGIPSSAVAKEGADIGKKTAKNIGSALHSEPQSAANGAKNFIEQRARAAGSPATAFEADKREKEGGVGPRPSYDFLKSKGLWVPKDPQPENYPEGFTREDHLKKIKAYNDEQDASFARATDRALAAKAAKAAANPPPPPKDEAPDEEEEDEAPPPAAAARPVRERRQPDKEVSSLQNAPPPALSNIARLRELYKEIEGKDIEGNPFLKNGRLNARSPYAKWWSTTVHGPDAKKHLATRNKIDARHDSGRPIKYSMVGLGKPKRGRSSGSAGSSNSDSDSEMKGTGKAKAPWQVAGSQAAKDRMADLRAKRGRTG
jgi:hypothetical protein